MTAEEKDAALIHSACLASCGSCAYPSLLQHLAEPNRAYHTASHVAAMLGLLETWEIHPSRALLAAVLYHDAVYSTQSGAQNEELSAQLCRDTCKLLSNSEIEEAARLILLTKAHTPSPDDRNGVLLVTADLWVLGGTPAEYAAYADAIRREYAQVPEDAWRSGRARVLRSFLERDRIYPASHFAPVETDARETAARRNLQHEIEMLEAS